MSETNKVKKSGFIASSSGPIAHIAKDGKILGIDNILKLLSIAQEVAIVIEEDGSHGEYVLGENLWDSFKDAYL